jgi:hypothetical protein
MITPQKQKEYNTNRRQKYKLNPIKILQRNKKWRKRNQNKLKEWDRADYQINKQKILTKSKEYYHKKKNIILQRVKRYYQKNREKIIQYNKKYQQRPEIKNELYNSNKIRRKEDKVWKEKMDIIRQTKHKFGSAKKYNCVLCDSVGEKDKAYQWHHYTEPYEIDKAIPLCKLHHKKVHY